MATVGVSPPTRAHQLVALPANVQISVFFYFYFTAIVKGVIALNVVCLERWKQELFNELFA